MTALFLLDDPSLSGAPPTTNAPARVTRGLRALYTFEDERGEKIRDRSGVGTPVDLVIDRVPATRRYPGRLRIHKPTIISTLQPPAKIYRAIRRSGAFTVEVWAVPADVSQKGPARIVSFSSGRRERNFTLGQEGKRLDARLRTTSRSTNGLPSLAGPERSARSALTHVVYSWELSGSARLYLDGKSVAETDVGGTLSNWNDTFRLALANEFGGTRSWLGELHLVAVYSRALSDDEVIQNFAAGSLAVAPAFAPVVRKKLSEKKAEPKTASAGTSLHFTTLVAPLLERHCIECHGARKQRGRLDLSQSETAFSGGKNGKVIVPGDAAASPLWESVQTDEMPKKRPPLSDAEKLLLREWIDAGAIWPSGVAALSRWKGDEPIPRHEEFQRDGTSNPEGDFQPREALRNPREAPRDPGPALTRRLTVAEYIETVRSALGIDVSKAARRLLPPDLRADGFSNTSYNLKVDLAHIGAYAELAAQIVDQLDIVGFAARHAPCSELHHTCQRKIIAAVGLWILRGPLEPPEIDAYLGISTAVADEGGDFAEALSYVLEAMLQSPRFIYRVEDQHGDGTHRPVSGYELASRLSYGLWGAPPDEELLRAAAAGELSDSTEVERQVERLLQDARAVETSSRFLEEWLNLERLDYLRPDPEHFPAWEPTLAKDMQEETRRFFREVAWKQGRPLSELLNAQFTYATPGLAKHYGLEPQGEGLSRYDLSNVPARGGLLTHGSVLTVGGDEASMVTRGLFVLQDILASGVEDPPPGVDTTPVPTEPGLSQRGIAEARSADSTCGGCHSRFEPFAFGLEKFDGVGAYHEKDGHGNLLREDGEILLPGTPEPSPYRSAAELMDLLAASPRVRECLTLKVTQFALGRPLVKTDTSALDRVHRAAQNGGGTYAGLIKAVMVSDLVQRTRTERN